MSWSGSIPTTVKTIPSTPSTYHSVLVPREKLFVAREYPSNAPYARIVLVGDIILNALDPQLEFRLPGGLDVFYEPSLDTVQYGSKFSCYISITQGSGGNAAAIELQLARMEFDIVRAGIQSIETASRLTSYFFHSQVASQGTGTQAIPVTSYDLQFLVELA